MVLESLMARTGWKTGMGSDATVMPKMKVAVVALVVGMLTGLVTGYPAAWVAKHVQTLSGGYVHLQEVSGTLWTGRALLVFNLGQEAGHRQQVAQARHLPSPVRWQLRPAWLGLNLQIASDCCTPQPLEIQVRVGMAEVGVEIAQNKTRWPLALLEGLGTPWNTLELQGVWEVVHSSLVWKYQQKQVRISGQVRMYWQNLQSRISTVQPLGSYAVDIDLEKPGPPQDFSKAITLTTLQGPLRLEGEGGWQSGRLHFSGNAQAEPGFEMGLNNLLNLVGRRQGSISHMTLQ